MAAAIVSGWLLDRFLGAVTRLTNDRVGVAIRGLAERAQLVPATVGVRS